MELVPRRNNAVNVNGNTVNGRTADIALTSHGSSFYFAICAAMAFSGFCFIGLAFRQERRNRLFHYITASVVFVAAIAYFTMGSNLGFTPIQVEYRRSNPKVAGTFRSIYYVRYIDWFITTPLLLLDLLLTAGMPWPTLLWVIVVDWIMSVFPCTKWADCLRAWSTVIVNVHALLTCYRIITGLIGALLETRYKWAYFTFGCVALVYIVYMLVWEARVHARAYGQDVERTFMMTGSLTTLLWILYPIAWGVSEGGNVIAPDSEAVFYGILDFFAKPIFGALLIWGHRNIDPARLGLLIKDYDGDALLNEKHKPAIAPAASPAQNGHTNGTTDGSTNGNMNVTNENPNVARNDTVPV